MMLASYVNDPKVMEGVDYVSSGTPSPLLVLVGDQLHERPHR